MDDTDREVAALITRLSARGTPLSRRRRRRALRRLAAVRTPEAVRVLALAYVSGRDKRVTAITAAAIADLDDPAAVDAVCEVLIATGDERLGQLVTEAGYGRSPPTVGRTVPSRCRIRSGGARSSSWSRPAAGRSCGDWSCGRLRSGAHACSGS